MTSRANVRNDTDVTNPIIALADVLLGLVLILAFVATAITLAGRVGWEELRYKDAQQQVREAVQLALAEGVRPYEDIGKSDPPGVQRWVFQTSQLFRADSLELSEQGTQVLAAFAGVLRENGGWRRIRIEGHTQPPVVSTENEWELSAARAASVARIFTGLGGIEPWFLAVAGRAGQNPVNRGDRLDPRNERVEILLEFSHGPSYSEVVH